MRLMPIAFVMLGACSLNVDYTGTYFACGENDSCPDGYVCKQDVCIPTEPDPPTCSSAIAAGGEHTCMVRDTDGTVWCWGRNSQGQLGNNSTTDSSLPVQVEGLTGVTTVVTGDQFSCALIDGGVECWGANDFGQLGDGSGTGSRTPVPAGTLTGITAVSAGAGHTCALASGGAVSCWGDNDHGQLGDGTNAPHRVPSAVPGVSATVIAVTDDSTCAVVNKTLTCWGDNSAGQFMTGMTGDVLMPAASNMISDVAGVALGGDHACVFTSTGTVHCAGTDRQGELGDGRAADGLTSAVPVDAPIPAKVIALSLGFEHSCAVDDSGGAWCWGNDEGRLGTGDAVDFLARPTLTKFQDVVAIAAGGDHTCARSRSGAIACAGFNGQGQLGLGFRITQTSPQPVEGLTNVTQLAAGGDYTCALDVAGTVKCWGNGDNGELGNGEIGVETKPVATLASGIKTLVSSGDHVCGITTDDHVTCWGLGTSGQLGDGVRSSRSTPLQIPSLSNVQQLALGDGHSCALTATELDCWGDNGSGELGAGADPILTPTLVPGIIDLPVKQVAAGGAHTCVIDGMNQVECFGSNGIGQLGANTSTSSGSSTPLKVVLRSATGTPLANVDEIATRGDDTFARVGGEVYGWGYGCDLHLPSQESTCSVTNSAAKLDDISNAMKLAVGYSSSCVLKTDNTVACWGQNYFGQIGNGTYDSTSPIPLVGLSGITDISAGGEHVCAVKPDKTVVCWGVDRSGQLGDGIREDIGPSFVRFQCE